MFWRKKSDGFDWHKHIRTTIKLRREARRQRLDDAVELAMGGIKGAGQASLAAGASSLDSVTRIITAPFIWIGRVMSKAWTFVAGGLASVLGPVGRLMERRGLTPAVGLLAAGLCLIGIGRAQMDGWDLVSIALALTGLALIVLLVAPPIFAERGSVSLTRLARRSTQLWPRVPGLRGITLPVQRMLTATALVISVGMLGWLGSAWIGRLSMASIASIPLLSRPPVEGAATVVSGDTLRINGQSIRLSGIEAPLTEQSCGGQGREARWRCGEAARRELGTLVRAKQVRCEIGGGGERGICRIGDRDIAAELVSKGHVFAQQGMFSSYGRVEQDARNAKRGIWKGVAERPEEFRQRHWDSASSKAPNGCPIKGQVSRNDRTYVAPWQTGYNRARVRTDKGERWFCSEHEAVAAGFKRQGA